jgi:N-carbamoylputrescine amidase
MADRLTRVTVCELNDDPQLFRSDWSNLVGHVKRERSDFVLLPEMPFGQWFASTPIYEPAAWRRAMEAHEEWLAKLGELSPAAILSTRPVERDGLRLNEAFAWSETDGYRPAHSKAYLPKEAGFWESSWYHAGDGAFEPIDVGSARVGFQICTEMWSMRDAQRYGKHGVDVIAIPRASSKNSVEKWRTGGRAAAIVSGAFTISSNRTSPDDGPDFGGGGWVISPDGVVLATTTRNDPIQTVEVDLTNADRAKATYPRYAIP